ncbi:MAG: hypothetical protein M3395_07100 [Chloroflexota bacterium]|nr:hypothetical protein [Chloroflexota bacterium]
MSRTPVLLLAGLLTLGACASPTPQPTGSSGPGQPSAPAMPSPAANACDPSGTAPASYPGWPGSEAQPSPAAGLVPLLVSSELAVGQNRFLFTLIDAQNRLIAAPEVEVDVRFFDLATDPATPVSESTAGYLQADEDRGLYRTAVDFSCSGAWGAELTAHIPGREQRQARVVFSVRPESSTPAIGAPVPATDTPTADSAEAIAEISTDMAPDPDFYRLSVDEALDAQEPFALVFATPAFCQTRACGPTLDIVRDVAADFKDDLAFIHVEPFVLEMTDAGLQPVLNEAQRFQSVPSVVEWGLPSEPYIFVVDDDGTLTAKFEGVAGPEELREAFEAVAAD